MSIATAVKSAPLRHALVVPEACDCGLCSPTWARRRGKSRRFTDAVTLRQALEGENREVRAGMVEEHLKRLDEMVEAADVLIELAPTDHPLRPEVGLGLVMFAGELASAIRPDEFGPELPEDLVSSSMETVTESMAAAAGCLASLSAMYQALLEVIDD